MGLGRRRANKDLMSDIHPGTSIAALVSALGRVKDGPFLKGSQAPFEAGKGESSGLMNNFSRISIVFSSPAPGQRKLIWSQWGSFDNRAPPTNHRGFRALIAVLASLNAQSAKVEFASFDLGTERTMERGKPGEGGQSEALGARIG